MDWKAFVERTHELPHIYSNKNYNVKILSPLEKRRKDFFSDLFKVQR